MNEELQRICKVLTDRGRQRGFLMIGEVQQELEEAEAPGQSFEVVCTELKKQGLETLDLDGQPFDPEVAEAVAHEPGGDGEPVVAEVLRRFELRPAEDVASAGGATDVIDSGALLRVELRPLEGSKI